MTAGELLVGVGTLALAGATVWLALEARRSRTQAEVRERRRLLRTALAEQLDNLRHWFGANPAAGDPALERIRRGGEPRLEAVGALLDQTDLPPDLAVYLVWMIGRVHDEWAWWTTLLSIGPSPNESPAAHPANSAVGIWARMVDRLQTIAALIACEASRRGYDELTSLHNGAPWVTVLEGPSNERELRWATDRTMLGAPPFPADAAFAEVMPGMRDLAGAETGARQKAALHEALNSEGRRLPPQG